LEQHIMATLAATGLPAERLDLEVTEGMLASDTGQFRAAMHSLRKNGIRLALDDFGTAYSSLSKLQGFPFQQIKIDRSFVNAIHDDENSIAILQAVFNMAVAMRLEVVVEGVETRAQLDTLGRLGCHFVQGYLLGRPQSPEWTREYLWQWHTNRSDPPAVAAAPGASTGGSRAP
jgi:EAL domain-containing protein (putative c-di-GMP-specific phosphodiesterase class I)